MDNPLKLNVKNLIPDTVLFVIGCLLQYIVVYFCVPLLVKTGIIPLGSWMILSIPLIFLPILIGGVMILRRERSRLKIANRLLLHTITKKDWLWCLLGCITVALGSLIMFEICALLHLNSYPPFAREVHPWIEGQLWMFPLWLLYWPFNILGENIVWRGIILPRMEVRLGTSAWLFNALWWGIFHLAFGPGNLIILLPTLIVVPFIAQKTRNTWTAVLVHACLSGPGFIALAFGLMK